MKHDAEDDINLVEGCLRKDLASWAALVKKYSGLIYISIENRLKKYGFALPRQDIEDIRQNILASIWKGKKLKDVKNRKDISYWLAIVSGNSAVNYIRRKRFQHESKTVSLFDKIDEKELAEFVPSAGLNPKDEASNNELSKIMDETIESLPAKEKLIIKLNLLHGKKHDEIADILKLPGGTVSSCIKRAKGKIREALEDFV